MRQRQTLLVTYILPSEGDFTLVDCLCIFGGTVDLLALTLLHNPVHSYQDLPQDIPANIQGTLQLCY